jgi:2'-5' RNA ligase
MSPLPKQFIDRWRDGYGAAGPGYGMLYWHVLMGSSPQLRDAAQTAQARISKFSGLHMTPLQWLHLTVLIAGPASQIPDDARDEMLTVARSSLSGIGPIAIEFSRIFYHPEAIVLGADPAEALSPIRKAAEQATRAVTGGRGTNARSSTSWVPHVTLCYSTSMQRAEPIIAALGTELPSCRVSVDTLSLVLQREAEWLWNWSPVGSVSLQDSLPTRLPGITGGTCCPPAVMAGDVRCGP